MVYAVLASMIFCFKTDKKIIDGNVRHFMCAAPPPVQKILCQILSYKHLPKEHGYSFVAPFVLGFYFDNIVL